MLPKANELVENIYEEKKYEIYGIGIQKNTFMYQ